MMKLICRCDKCGAKIDLVNTYSLTMVKHQTPCEFSISLFQKADICEECAKELKDSIFSRIIREE